MPLVQMNLVPIERSLKMLHQFKKYFNGIKNPLPHERIGVVLIIEVTSGEIMRWLSV